MPCLYWLLAAPLSDSGSDNVRQMANFEEILLKLPKPYYRDSEVAIFRADCRDILPLIPDKSIDLVLTDPPYGITACQWDRFVDLSEMWQYLKRIAMDNTAFVFTAYQPFTTDLIQSNRDCFKYTLVWIKNTITGHLYARKQFMRRHEDVAVFYDHQCVFNPQMIKRSWLEYKDCLRTNNAKRNARSEIYDSLQSEIIRKPSQDQWFKYPNSVLEFDIDDVRNGANHPTQKPIGLFQFLMATYSNHSSLILDPFLGSGTTAYCAKKLGRKCIGIEIESKYCRIAAERCAQAVLPLKVEPEIKIEQGVFVES